jgi:hypothetical protein
LAGDADQIRKAGLLYDSSFMAMHEPYELLANGQTWMIELPIRWIADDYPYYQRTRRLVARPAVGL